MNRFIHAIIAIILAGGVLFSVGAVLSWTIDWTKWDIEIRGLVAVLSAFALLFIASKAMNEDPNTGDSHPEIIILGLVAVVVLFLLVVKLIVK